GCRMPGRAIGTLCAPGYRPLRRTLPEPTSARRGPCAVLSSVCWNDGGLASCQPLGARTRPAHLRLPGRCVHRTPGFRAADRSHGMATRPHMGLATAARVDCDLGLVWTGLSAGASV